MGISMGGQQSLCVAGLHPQGDAPDRRCAGRLRHQRPAARPAIQLSILPSNDPKIMETALYFDAVNFAPRIKATSLVAMGFVDTISAPGRYLDRVQSDSRAPRKRCR